MLIAIHKRPGSFSDRWIAYCEENKIPYKIVNCYDSNIIDQLKDCDGLMWHWSHIDYRAQNFARQLIYSLEKMGKKVFPSFDICWHFDDKIGQKYLLEAIGAPFVRSHVFYDEKDANKWFEKASFPVVFKLRGGAGSLNVTLIREKKKAKKFVKKSFSKGFPLVNTTSNLWQSLWVLKRDKNFWATINLLKKLVRVLFPKKETNLLPRQKGYFYCQDFIPNNDFDDRIVIIGERAIAIRRYNRSKDFRASGSGLIDHNYKIFNLNTIKMAFDISKKIGSQSLTFDIIYENNEPKITEISYAFVQGPVYDNCPGYWDSELNWHKDYVDPQRYIIEDFISSIKNQHVLKK